MRSPRNHIQNDSTKQATPLGRTMTKSGSSDFRAFFIFLKKNPPYGGKEIVKRQISFAVSSVFSRRQELQYLPLVVDCFQLPEGFRYF